MLGRLSLLSLSPSRSLSVSISVSMSLSLSLCLLCLWLCRLACKAKLSGALLRPRLVALGWAKLGPCGLCWAHLGPMSSLCWAYVRPMLACVGLGWAYVGVCWPHVGCVGYLGPMLGICEALYVENILRYIFWPIFSSRKAKTLEKTYVF